MNILFITSFLLLVLSILAGRAFSSAQILTTEKTSLLGRFEGMVQTRNTLETRLFIKSTKPPQQVRRVQKETGKAKAFSSHRVQSVKIEMSKLSITPLFEEELESEKLLFNTACRLLEGLYGEMPFIKAMQNSHWQEDLLKELIKEGKKADGEIDLATLRPLKEPLSSIYYKIVKGTPGYDVRKGIGIPPLTDFFSISERRRKPIFFCYASEEVLTAALGSSLCDLILSKEKERSNIYGGRRVLLEKELEQIVCEHDARPDMLLKINELFLYSKKFIPLESLCYKDEASQVYFYQSL